jgi:hypothetical protein
MNMRERMLAVIQGREHDRVPFVQYHNIAARNEEIWAVIGRENMGTLHWCTTHDFDLGESSCETIDIERNGLRGIATTIHTPFGKLSQEQFYDPALGSLATREHYVKEPEDYRILAGYLRSLAVVEYPDGLREALAAAGDNGLPHPSVPRTPFQQMWIQWVSLEDLCVHLHEHPEIVTDCLDLLGKQLREVFQIVRRADVPYVVIPDNITAPAIGERYFRQYCLPYYQELADLMAERGIPVYVHMDGDLKPLWPAIAESNVRGLDSFSPPPDNDTSPAEAAAMWPEMRLGVNFPSSVHLSPPEKVYETAMDILGQAGHTGRLQIQISENVPPGVWKKSYPAIVKAIADFGKP